MSAYETLERLGLTLPVPTPPVAAFELWVQSGNLLFVSGHIAKRDGVPWAGQLGRELTVSEGQEAARLVALDLLGTLHAATGNLDRLRLVKLLVLVNSTPEFFQQHLVANGASEFLVTILGDKGKHARSAFGAAQIPFGACVEIELIAEIS